MNQNQKILNHLKEHKKITSYEAFEKYRITRLSARIHDLREQGHNITSDMVYGNEYKYAVYRLEERMKRAKKPKSQTVTLKRSDISKIKREVAEEVTDKACLIILAAMTDELNINDDQLCAVMTRTQRYSGYIKEHLVQMELIRKTIEKNTGVKLKGWIKDA